MSQPPSQSTLSLEDRFVGCLLGLALGDALGAPHEGGPAERLVWRLLGLASPGVMRWSDDTQMAVGLAQSLVERGGLDCDHAARLWARSARFSRGYGPGTWKILSRIRSGEPWSTACRAVHPEGSYGNGAAMRAAPLGLFYHDRPAELARAAAAASAVTHAHPLGIAGGVMMARAAALALEPGITPERYLATLAASSEEPEFKTRLERAEGWLAAAPTHAEVRRRLGNAIAAHESVVTAIYAFCRSPEDFTAMTDFIISLGGDTDTIAAMAGGLFGAKNGWRSLPAAPLDKLEDRDSIERLGRSLYRARASGS